MSSSHRGCTVMPAQALNLADFSRICPGKHVAGVLAKDDSGLLSLPIRYNFRRSSLALSSLRWPCAQYPKNPKLGKSDPLLQSWVGASGP